MSRHVVTHTIEAEGRDKGKIFVITEMSAGQGEAWAIRVLLALIRSNPQIPEGFDRMGMAGLAEMGVKALGGIRWEDLEPLLAEMFSCVKHIPDPKKMHVSRPLIEQDIEEIATRFELRKEVWSMHMGFLKAVAPSLLAGE